MKVGLGIKSDPVEYRYSYEWLFALMERLSLHHLQLGTFFEMYDLPDRYFQRLSSAAADHGVRVSSCFTAHRELGGFFLDEPEFHEVARRKYERYVEIGALLGAESVGSNPGAVLRDRMDTKDAAVERYLVAMEKLTAYAAQAGLSALTLETMSAMAEPPTTRAEISYFMNRLNPERSDSGKGRSTPARTPVYVCGDLSHGYADAMGSVVETNVELFEHSIPWMWEFHIKNTDALFSSTFGFGPEETRRGIVNLRELAALIQSHAGRFPRDTIVGYLELPGPKLGRDYSDGLLEAQITSSVDAIRRDFVSDTSQAIKL